MLYAAAAAYVQWQELWAAKQNWYNPGTETSREQQAMCGQQQGFELKKSCRRAIAASLSSLWTMAEMNVM